MGSALIEMLPFALGKMIAVNPTIAVILLLVGAQGRGKACAYVVGALLGPLVAGTVLLPLAGTVSPHESGDGPTPFGSALRLIIGLAFLVLAFHSWHQHTATKTAPPALPGWMQALSRIGTLGALGLGATMTVFGIKNLLLLTGLVAAISEDNLGFGQSEIVLIGFVLISTIPVAAPLVAAHLLGPRADSVLGAWKAWLARNSALVTFGLFLCLGAYFTLRGFGGLLGARA